MKDIADVLSRVAELSPTISGASRAIEEGRRLPADVVRGLAEAGCFRVALPTSLGGLGASATDVVDVIERVARADGSAGWCVMIGITSSFVAGFLEPAVGREIFADPMGVTAGVFAPMGKAKVVDGGYDVTGRWSFASGCEHSAWRMAGVVVMDDAGPRRGAHGGIETMQVMLRASDTRVVDTWTVSGLRGTGSHDIACENVFVPASHTLDLASAPRTRDGVFALPVLGVLAAGVAAVALGTAVAALDAFVEIARTKKPMGAKRTVAERELVQALVAEADADIGAARAWLKETLRASSASPEDVTARARLRIAATRATHGAASVVERLYKASGGAAVYATHPMQRYFRDVFVATQHVMVGEQLLAVGGRALLGLEVDPTML